MARLLVDGLQFPEGPIWSAKDACLYFVEWQGNRVCAYRDDTVAPVFAPETGSGPSGLGQDTAGNFWICLYDARKLAQFSPQGDLLQSIEAWRSRSFRGVCDLVLDYRGGVYFSDSGDFHADWTTGRPAGALYYLGSTGELRKVADNLRFPNGLALSADGQTLYVSEHRANQVLAYTVSPGGLLADRRILYKLDDNSLLAPDSRFETGPDGLCLGDDGSIWIAHYGGGKVVHISPEGQHLGEISLERGRKPTNVAFQADKKRLYVTEAEYGGLFQVELIQSS